MLYSSLTLYKASRKDWDVRKTRSYVAQTVPDIFQSLASSQLLKCTSSS